MIALPVVMLFAEPAIVAMSKRAAADDDTTTGTLRAGDRIHRPHPLLGWVPIPGASGRHVVEGSFDVTYELDEKGRKAIPKNPGAERTIHFFGDSFTFRHGVANEDTALNLVARTLGDRASVVNWGVMGYGLEQMFLRLREAQDEIHAGDVVVFSPLSDDLQRNLIDERFVCYIYRKNYSRVLTFPMLDGDRWRSIRLAEVCPEGDLPLAMVRRHLLKHRAMQSSIFPNADQIFAQAKAITEQRAARFEVLFLLKRQECQSQSFEVAVDRLRTPFSTVIGYCPSSDEVAKLFFPTDGHLDPAGNRWLATAILDFLNRRILEEATF